MEVARPKRRSLWPAIWVSLAGHALVLGILLLIPSTGQEPGPSPIQVFTVAQLPSGLPTPAPGSASVAAGGNVHGSASTSVASPQPTGSPTASGSSLAAGPHSLLEMIEEHFRKETFAPPEPGSTPTARRDSPTWGEETDSLDGVPHLGSGEPGDPRIPGSGGVDIAKVLRRDAIVAQAQCRAAAGQVHPFLGEAKSRIEDHWLPVAADLGALPNTRATPITPDHGCPYYRYRVGRVLAIYDSQGNQLSVTVVDVPHDRQLAER